jgi:hypothetical protein
MMASRDSAGPLGQAQLLAVANIYFEALAERDFPAMPYADSVSLDASLGPGSLEAVLKGRDALRAIWWPPLAAALGEVTVLEHYVNEDLTAVCTEALVTLGSPPVRLHVLNRFSVDAQGRITEQLTWSRRDSRSP